MYLISAIGIFQESVHHRGLEQYTQVPKQWFVKHSSVSYKSCDFEFKISALIVKLKQSTLFVDIDSIFSLMSKIRLLKLLHDEEFLLPSFHAGAGRGRFCGIQTVEKIEGLPPVLTLHLRRFEQSQGQLRKCDDEVKFPAELDMADFCTQGCIEVWHCIY